MLIQADAVYLPYADKYFHSAIFSPPYWGLRKYSGNQGEEPLGLEASPERYIERMVEVLRDIRRVLRDDGVVWMNVGDCYAANRSYQVQNGKNTGGVGIEGLPSKACIAAGNLMLLPHRLAIALQDDGWIIRNDVVWHKKNPMPESINGWRWERCRRKVDSLVGQGKQGKDYAGSFEGPINGGKDLPVWEACPGCKKCAHNDGLIFRKASWRHTRGHEYVFQLVKKMSYYCNREVVKEKSTTNNPRRPYTSKGAWEMDGRSKDQQYGGKPRNGGTSGRTPRSVMNIATAPYKGAHYAVYPPDLIRPLIAASVPEKCCAKCGQAWAPIVKRGTTYESGSGRAGSKVGDIEGKHQTIETLHSGKGHDVRLGPVPNNQILGYKSTCKCGCMKHVPGIVLDPFGGSGTTGMVAGELGRRWVVQDISHEYLDEQAKVRTEWSMK